MAILIPTLQHVRQQTKAVGCQSNLKQWCLISALYTNENDGRLPTLERQAHQKTLSNSNGTSAAPLERTVCQYVDAAQLLTLDSGARWAQMFRP
jgi:hypothetical protein